jgi:hypothetical protein
VGSSPIVSTRFKRVDAGVDVRSMANDFSSLLDELVGAVNAAGAEIRAKREAAPPLDPAVARVIVDAYLAELRALGWLTEVEPEQLDGILEIVVMTEDDGSESLDVESNVTESVWGVPGWGVTETDPVQIGRGLAQDESEFLEAMRDAGEVTGWE